jgi:NhaA family Na+:H+ antiporter
VSREAWSASVEPRRRSLVLNPFRSFLRTEAGGGAVLLAAALAAIVWANSPWRGAYHDLWTVEVAGGSLHHWVNDGLMTLFFFVVGLEIKRELVRGELQDRRTALLPVLAALGGMVVPAGLFLLVAGSGEARHGWGIPMATDIAFAVGVLSLFGRRVPHGLKLFVLTLAIVDDIGAIVVIAVFYAEGHFGIHPTIVAVALGLLVPAGDVRGRPVLDDLQRRLHPWSSYLVVPLFALANAGVDLGAAGEAFAGRLTWAVMIGLVAGKLVGIAGTATGAARLGLGRSPAGVGARHLAGAGAIGGIGFTVSLFITGLAFDDEVLQAQAKIGILAASLLAALLGMVLLRWAQADS